MPTPPAILSSASEADVARACAAHRPHLTTPAEFHALREHAQAHKARAYCPYSRFRVGAAVLTSGGKLVGGANVENASYPVTTCAERVAIGRAVADGHLHEHHQAGKGGGGGGGFIRAVAVATDLPAPGSPCGMCRQWSVSSLSPYLLLSCFPLPTWWC